MNEHNCTKEPPCQKRCKPCKFPRRCEKCWREAEYLYSDLWYCTFHYQEKFHASIQPKR